MSVPMRHILLVEPEAIVAEVASFRLELLDYRVTCVASAEAALEEIGQSLPDLVITDLDLPGMSGMGLIERLTTDESTSGLKIMVLSIDADLSRVQTAYHTGARDFLVVPFHPEVLEEKVARLLASSGSVEKAIKPKSRDSVVIGS